MRIDLMAVVVVVEEYDPAIAFFVDALGFELVEDSAQGMGKRWVVVRPPGAETGILLARADGDGQRGAMGNQAGGRVGFLLRVDDFDAQQPGSVSARVDDRSVWADPLDSGSRLA